MSNSPYTNAGGFDSNATLVQPDSRLGNTARMAGSPSALSKDKKKQNEVSDDPNAMSDSKFRSQAKKQGWSTRTPSGASFSGF